MTTWTNQLPSAADTYVSGLATGTTSYSDAFASGADSYSSGYPSAADTYEEERQDHGWPSLLTDVDGNDPPGYYVDATLIDCLGENIWTATQVVVVPSGEVTLGGEDVTLGGEEVQW